jgi:hypothetical protein
MERDSGEFPAVIKGLKMGLVTQEVRQIEEYINKTWRQFSTKKEVQLRKLFPEPENEGLHHIWRYGSADLVVYKNGKAVLIIESGGSHHWEKKQALNDRRKSKLADMNNVKCLIMMNGLSSTLSRRQWRGLIGSHLFGCQKRKTRRQD